MDSFKKYFIKAVEHNFPVSSDKIMADTDAYYKTISIDTRFAKTSANPIDKRLDFCSYFLALIKTFDEQGENFEMIRKVCLEVVTDYVQPKNKIQALLKRLPAKLTNTWFGNIIIKAFNKKVSQRSQPDGFLANIITNKEETFGLGYGVDILECGICKVFKKHRYEKYASILCEVDELTSNMAGLQLIRTGTIALGAKKCDFRYKKINT